MHGAPRMVTWRFCSSRRRAPRQVPTCASCAGAAYRSSSRVDPTSSCSPRSRRYPCCCAFWQTATMTRRFSPCSARPSSTQVMMRCLPCRLSIASASSSSPASRVPSPRSTTRCVYMSRRRRVISTNRLRARSIRSSTRFPLRQVPPSPRSYGRPSRFPVGRPRWPRVVSREERFSRTSSACAILSTTTRRSMVTHPLRRAATFAVSLIWHTRAWLRAPSSERS